LSTYIKCVFQVHSPSGFLEFIYFELVYQVGFFALNKLVRTCFVTRFDRAQALKETPDSLSPPADVVYPVSGKSSCVLLFYV